MSTVRITRKYAEWMEDAISVVVPDISPVTDDDLRDNFDELYGAAMSGGTGNTQIVAIDCADGSSASVEVYLDWEDEHRMGLDFPEEELELEHLDAP